MPGRYAFHDLLRSYAVERAEDQIPSSERNTVQLRTLDHYLQSAHAARVLLYPGHDTIRLDPPLPGVRPESFAAKQAALEWLDAEYQVLLKAIDGSVRNNLDDYAWKFPVVLWTYYYVCGHWHDGVATQRVAVEAARRRGERNGFARAMRGLGGALTQLGEYAEAQEWLRRARGMFEETGDLVGLTRTALIMSQAFDYQGLYTDSLRAADDALTLAAAAPGDPHMQLLRAAALNNSAWCALQLGELEQARDAAWRRSRCAGRSATRRARRAPGTPWVRATGTWASTRRRCGAWACLGLARLRERLQVASTSRHLAETHQAAGDIAAARSAWAGPWTLP